MLRETSRYIRRASPKSLPIYRQHIDNLKTYKNEHLNRFLKAPGYESYGMRLLRHILSFVNYTELNKLMDDYDKYNFYMRHIEDDLDGIFNPVRTGRCHFHHFLDKSVYMSNEYLTPTNDNNYLKILPFNESYNEWMKLSPVTVWYYDSTELSQHLLGNMVRFKYFQPIYSLIFIDSVMLVMMYIKYLKNINYDGRRQEDLFDNQRKFLHEHVFSKMYNQTLDIWLFNQISELTDCETEDDVIRMCNINKSLMDNRYGYVGGRYMDGNLELFKELQKVKNGNTSISSLFSSKLFLDDSLIDKMEHATTYLGVPELRQYKYLTLMRDFPILELIVKFYKHTPNISEGRSLIRDLKMIVRRLMNDNIIDTIKNGKTKEVFKDRFMNISNLLNTFDV